MGQFRTMANISEQKVTVLCDFTESMNGLILHGIFIASFLDKELCLFSLVPSKENKTEIQEKLGELAGQVKARVKKMVVSTLVLKGKLEQNAEKLADKYDSVLLILNKSKLQEKMKSLGESTIPYLFAGGKTTDLITYKRVILPVDFRKEMKETSLWASYLGRFNNALVQAVGATEKDTDNEKKTKKNLLFIRKFLNKMKVNYTLEESKANSWNIQFEALRMAQTGKGDVLIILGSKHITPIDLLIGLPEKKIIKRANQIPVLCINPSKDMNILCD